MSTPAGGRERAPAPAGDAAQVARLKWRGSSGAAQVARAGSSGAFRIQYHKKQARLQQQQPPRAAATTPGPGAGLVAATLQVLACALCVCVCCVCVCHCVWLLFFVLE